MSKVVYLTVERREARSGNSEWHSAGGKAQRFAGIDYCTTGPVDEVLVAGGKEAPAAMQADAGCRTKGIDHLRLYSLLAHFRVETWGGLSVQMARDAMGIQGLTFERGTMNDDENEVMTDDGLRQLVPKTRTIKKRETSSPGGVGNGQCGNGGYRSPVLPEQIG
nr:hypothetical protein CFP56_62869 [Quercus suber]